MKRQKIFTRGAIEGQRDVGVLVSIAALAFGMHVIAEPEISLALPYGEVVEREYLPGVVVVRNLGADPLPYLGPSSTVSMEFGQLGFRFADTREPIVHTNETREWEKNVLANEPMYLPAGKDLTYYVGAVPYPYRASVRPVSVRAVMLIGKGKWIESQPVDAPMVLDKKIEEFPELLYFDMAFSRPDQLVKCHVRRVEFEEETFLYMQMENHMVYRIARVPPNCEPVVEFPKEYVFVPTGAERMLTVDFGNANYGRLKMNLTQFQIVTGHPETVPNAFMRTRCGVVSNTLAQRLREENRGKRWLRSSAANTEEGDRGKTGAASGAVGSPSPERASEAGAGADASAIETRVWIWIAGCVIAAALSLVLLPARKKKG